MKTDPKIHCLYTELRAPGTLKENPQNPNKHPPAQLELMAKVIRRAGWRSPIIVSALSGYIVRGAGRTQAALLGGFGKVPVQIQKYASAAEEHADMLADNRLAELSALDPGKTKTLMQELKGAGADLDLTGYTPDELAQMFAPPELVKMKISAPPKLAWALIGVPLASFKKVQALLDKLPADAVIHTTANDGGKPSK